MKHARLAVLLSLALAGSIAATKVMAQEPVTAGDPVRGGVLADTCMGCHGIDGYRNGYPSYRVPKLGGQHPDYIVLALQGYKNKTRPHPTMQAQAWSQSEQDMRDIAAFFASEGAIRKAAAPEGEAPAKAATCVACHGEGGISIAPNWPSLAGQHEDYLVHALNQYKTGERKDPVMGSQAITLTQEEIEELAAYFADQSGLFGVHYALGAKSTNKSAQNSDKNASAK